MSEKNGFILLARTLLTSELMDKPPLYAKTWLYLLLQAQYREGKSVKRGQLMTSLQELIEAGSFKSGYRMEYPTKKQVRDMLAWFREQDMIRTEKTTRGLIITIVNYELYQDPANYTKHQISNPEEHNPEVTSSEGHGKIQDISILKENPGHTKISVPENDCRQEIPPAPRNSHENHTEVTRRSHGGHTGR